MTKTPSTDRSHIAHIPQTYLGVALVNRCQGMFLNEIHWGYDDALEAWREHTATNGSGDDPDEQIVSVAISITDPDFRLLSAKRGEPKLEFSDTPAWPAPADLPARLYVGWVFEHGFPNGLPTWDELPDLSPSRRAADPLCKQTWIGIAGFVDWLPSPEWEARQK